MTKVVADIEGGPGCELVQRSVRVSPVATHPRYEVVA